MIDSPAISGDGDKVPRWNLVSPLFRKMVEKFHGGTFSVTVELLSNGSILQVCWFSQTYKRGSGDHRKSSTKFHRGTLWNFSIVAAIKGETGDNDQIMYKWTLLSSTVELYHIVPDNSSSTVESKEIVPS